MGFRIRGLIIPKELDDIIVDKKSDRLVKSVLNEFGDKKDFAFVYMCMLYGIHVLPGQVPKIPTDEDNWVDKNQVQIKGGVTRDFNIPIEANSIHNVTDRILRSFIKNNGLIKADNVEMKNKMYNLLESILENKDMYWERILIPFYLEKATTKDKLGISFISRLSNCKTLKVEEDKTLDEVIDDSSITHKNLEGDFNSIEQITQEFINKQDKFLEETKLENIKFQVNKS